MTQGQQYFDRYTRRSIDVLRYAEWARRQVVGAFEEMIDRIRREILLADPDDNWDRSRLEALILLLFGIIDSTFEDMEDRTTELLLSLADAEASFFDATAQAVLGADTEVSAGLSGLTLIGLASSEVLGGTRQEFFQEYRDQTKRRLARQMRQTFTQDRSAKALVDALLGQATSRRIRVTLLDGTRKTVTARDGGALRPSRNEINNFVRTAVEGTSSAVLQAAIDRNPGQFELLQANTILDGRTSIICLSRTGGLWYAETGQPHPDSAANESFPGYPPWHPNCRSSIVPIPAGADPPKIPGFEVWLKDQPVELQKDVLGLGRWKMWRQGKLSLHELLDTSGRPLTLRELRQRV